MANPNMRCCSICGRELPATNEYFFADKRVSSGLRAECKPCHMARTKANYAKNPRKRGDYMRRRRLQQALQKHGEVK